MTDRYNVPLTTSTIDLRRHPGRRLRRLVRRRAHAVDPHDLHHPPRGLLLAGDPLHVRARHRRRRPRRPRSSTSATASRSRSSAASSRSSPSPTTRFKLNAVLAFWLAYILTRPLGASIGDFMSQNSQKYGGLGPRHDRHELHLPRRASSRSSSSSRSPGATPPSPAHRAPSHLSPLHQPSVTPASTTRSSRPPSLAAYSAASAAATRSSPDAGASGSKAATPAEERDRVGQLPAQPLDQPTGRR